ncbi:membrane protein insertase YidC [Aliikangiella marina]|uniref:Membrane protein insertase YidC n=1 Tax=Aliikangiella marina TaxID=1712262 RepID=A0A545T1G6_9GAMM|nr:membrane protein insertase YidC [Aliikangiella marina]TQV71066.1 membrane protein insertase YidC [Aliikangiella marina]
MESARTFLFIAFAVLTFLLYLEWQEYNAPPPVEKAPIVSSLNTPTTIPTTADPVASSSSTDDIAGELPTSSSTPEIKPSNTNNRALIMVTTDVLRVTINPVQGDLVSAELLNYKETLEENSQPINILENRNGRVYEALSGLYGENAPNFPGNVAIFDSSQRNYELTEGDDSIDVDLTWTNAKGVVYTKRYTFSRAKYNVEVKYLVNNQSGEKIANRMFTALKRDMREPEGQKSEGIGMTSYIGPAYSTEESKYEKYDFEDLQEADLNTQTQGGWVAMLQHYFVSAWVPRNNDVNKIDTTTDNLGKSGLVQIRITQDWQWIEPGQTGEYAATFYVGPKIQAELEQIADGLELTVDYGFLWWIGQPIFFLLLFFQGFVINWGVAIILVTFAIKMLLYPLARAQYRSFAKMRLLQPKLTAMKERYGDDRQQFSMKMMELYKKEKVNPLGGCFPLLVQMPVFIALYWVLMESVELRHAPFMLWIDDLAVKDPYWVLPLLMGASMYLMQKMQPTSPTMDPMQQKIFQMMPVFMTVFFVFFPAGLVLYWLMNNLISIAQQLYITNQFNKEQEAKNLAKGK